MSAEIIRMYRDMPQALCQTEADEAVALHIAELRRDRLPALRADWAANRLTQQQALDAQNVKNTRRQNRRLIGCGAALFLAFALALTVGHAITSAWTASIAADLAR